jgi:hypothetical protein
MLIIARSVTSALTSRILTLGEITVDLRSRSYCTVGGKAELLHVFYVETTYEEL